MEKKKNSTKMITSVVFVGWDVKDAKNDKTMSYLTCVPRDMEQMNRNTHKVLFVYIRI